MIFPLISRRGFVLSILTMWGTAKARERWHKQNTKRMIALGIDWNNCAGNVIFLYSAHNAFQPGQIWYTDLQSVARNQLKEKHREKLSISVFSRCMFRSTRCSFFLLFVPAQYLGILSRNSRQPKDILYCYRFAAPVAR